MLAQPLHSGTHSSGLVSYLPTVLNWSPEVLVRMSTAALAAAQTELKASLEPLEGLFAHLHCFAQVVSTTFAFDHGLHSTHGKSDRWLAVATDSQEESLSEKSSEAGAMLVRPARTWYIFPVVMLWSRVSVTSRNLS